MSDNKNIKLSQSFSAFITKVQEEGWTVLQLPKLYQAIDFKPIHETVRFIRVRNEHSDLKGNIVLISINKFRP